MEITSENFKDFFHDVRLHRPKKGEVLAKYSAVAYFEDGPEKWNMIDLLNKPDKAHAATQVMKRCLFASEKDSISVPRQMAEDLLTMTRYDVSKKPYKYTFEMYFYTLPEYVPVDDPHWSTITLIDVGQIDVGHKEIVLDPSSENRESA
jgi:hypothetical protein